MAMDRTNASTPPNLLGIDRRIAYAIKKYHSDWIWTGVTKGLAGMKFSGSLKVKGWIDKLNLKLLVLQRSQIGP